ncbi:MAG TPA: mannitol dehydrogenase family protein [Solirubrobacteraceae bacterium]|nr:mannitol dehydrogenase family protein [Solirubrobacteraceae bacterium]
MAVPSYDRTALAPAVVHMSVGHFHRAHQAMYFDDLARRGVRGWGLVGVGLRRREMQDALAAQDGLYTVVERGAAGDRARVVGVIRAYLFAPDAPEAVVERLAHPHTRLVTFTVTGAAYHVDFATGEFDAGHPEVVADLADPARPISALGFLVEGLDRRRRAGLPPFTILSCDNVAANGDLTRTAVVEFARRRDERLAGWIERSVAFPSSMVDRITPVTTDADRELVAREFGIADRWPVMTEPFSQWVVEDEFCSGRPPLDAAGVQFVPDVRPYALIKTRLLNASHSALGYLGFLAGLRRADEAMADPAFAEYVERTMEEEIAPLLPAVVGLDLAEYRRTVVDRLANPKIGDQLERLCRNGSAKVPCHLLPSIADRRARGLEHPLLTLAVAGWCRYLRGVGEDGLPIAVDDPLAGRLRLLAGPDPRPLLAEGSLFGALSGDEGFAAELEAAIAAIDRDGTRAALAACLAGEGRLAA